MTTLTSDYRSSEHQTSGFSLRIDQPSVGQSTIVLPVGKCTVGSSDRCQVHLTAAGVRPLHCLIVLEENQVTVTRWAPGVLLNGVDFSTSLFTPGDCLQIGDAKLTLIVEQETTDVNNSLSAESISPERSSSVAPSQTESTSVSSVSSAFASLGTASFGPPPAPSVVSPTNNAAPVATPPVTPDVSSQEINPTPSQTQTPETAQEVNRLKTANHDARNRSRNLISALRATRTEAAGFELKIDDLQQQLTNALEVREEIYLQLSLLQDETSNQENESSEQIDQLIDELNTAHGLAQTAETKLTETTQQAAELQSKLTALEQQRDEWEQIRSAGEVQRSKLAQALADREQSVESLQAELENAREAANSADANRMDQSAALATLQQELEQLQAEQTQLTDAKNKSQQKLQRAEQALATSEQTLAILKLEVEKLQLTGGQFEEDLNERNASYEYLEAEYLQLVSERDQLVAKRTEHQLSEQGHEHELANRQEKIESLTQEIEELRAAVTQANLTAADQTEIVERIQDELNAITTERDQLLAAQAEQVRKNQEWEETVAVRDRRIQELEAEHDGICQVLQSVEEGAFEQVDFCRKLETQLAALREERDQLAEAMPEQQEYIRQLSVALTERDTQITQLSEELVKTTERQTTLETELLDGTTAYEALEGELNELSSRCQQLLDMQSTSEKDKSATEQTLSAKQTQIEELQQQLDATNQTRLDLEQAVTEASHAETKAQNELNELQTRLAQLSTEYQESTENCSGLQQQLAEREQQAELFKADLTSLQAELKYATDQSTSLQADRDTLATQLAELREELSAKTAAESEVDAELQQQQNELANELATVRQELENAQLQISANGDETEASQELLTNLEAEKTALQQKLEEQTQQAEQAILEFQQQHDELSNQLTAAREELVDWQSRSSTEGETANDLQSIIANLESEKSSLQQNSTEQAQQTEQLTSELEETKSQLFAGQGELAELTKLYEQSQQELQLAQEGLKLAEQSVTEQATPATVNEQPVDNTSDESQQEPSTENDVENETAENGVSDSTAEADSYDSIDWSTPTSTDVEPETLPSETEASEPFAEPEAAKFGTSAFDAPATDDASVETEFKPTSFLDQYQDMLEEDDAFAPEPAAPVQPSEPAPPENKLGAELDSLDSNGETDSDEVDVEAYMSNMLARMRGENIEENAPAPQSVSETPKQTVEPAVDVVEKSPLATEAPLEELENLEPMTLEELKRPSHKPELTADLSAMRELANSSARTAIAKHHKRRHMSNALGMLVACLIATSAGGYLLSVGMKAQEFLGAKFLGGSALVFVGLIGGLKLLSLLMLAIREGSWEGKTPAKNSEEGANTAVSTTESNDNV